MKHVPTSISITEWIFVLQTDFVRLKFDELQMKYINVTTYIKSCMAARGNKNFLNKYVYT